MRGALSTWQRPPRATRQPQVQLENIALVPASELASLAEWQKRAQRLSPGATLLVVPSNNRRVQEMGNLICRSLHQRGRRSAIALLHPPESD